MLLTVRDLTEDEASQQGAKNIKIIFSFIFMNCCDLKFISEDCFPINECKMSMSKSVDVILKNVCCSMRNRQDTRIYQLASLIHIIKICYFTYSQIEI